MKRLLEAINRGILRGLNEQNIELLTDLDDDNLDQQNSIQVKSMNNKIDYSIKQQLADAIQTGKIHNSLKQFINNPNNFSKLKGLIKANNREHLEQLIEIGQELFGDDGNFNWIDTSEITDMSYLFGVGNNSVDFNGHIELWDVSNVADMTGMFYEAESFNQPIGDWDVSNVTNMSWMFYGTYEFNQPLGDWDVSNVTDMTEMFDKAASFNQSIGNWNVSNVNNMPWMFASAYDFNQPIGDWDVSNVVSMSGMFFDAKSFNQDISQWNIKKVKDYDDLYYNCPIEEEYKPKFIEYLN